MVTVVAEGIDYSRGGFPHVDLIRDAGKSFVGRYAVSDESPAERGIVAAEYDWLTSAGIDIFLYWEGTESWMLGGHDAGARAAENALANIRRAGMPEGMPVYYSHDIEPDPAHFAAIDACIAGAASVVGPDRVAGYGGWLLIDHWASAGNVRYLAQTLAWQGNRGVHPAAHLHQWGFNHWIDGVECDDVSALKPHYGQARDFLPHPTPAPAPAPKPLPAHRIPAPDKLIAQGHALTPNDPDRFTCTQGGHFKTTPSLDAPDGTPSPYRAHDTYTFPWRARVKGVDWLVSRAGSWAPAKNFRPE